MSFAAVQKHVAVLERAGLLTKRRQGREALASGDVEAVRSVGVMLTELEALWRGRISRMDELFATDTHHRHHHREGLIDHACHRRPARPRRPHPDHHRRLRRAGRPRVAGVRRPAPARARVGSPRLPGHVRRPRAHPRRPDELLHDQPGGREVLRLLGHRRGRRADRLHLHRRLRRRRDLHPQPRPAGVGTGLLVRRARRRHPGHVRRDLRHRRGPAEGARHGRRSRGPPSPSTRSTTCSLPDIPPPLERTPPCAPWS